MQKNTRPRSRTIFTVLMSKMLQSVNPRWQQVHQRLQMRRYRNFYQIFSEGYQLQYWHDISIWLSAVNNDFRAWVKYQDPFHYTNLAHSMTFLLTLLCDFRPLNLMLHWLTSCMTKMFLYFVSTKASVSCLSFMFITEK